MLIVSVKRLFLKTLALPLISLLIVTVFVLQACVSFCPWRSPSFPGILSRMFSPPTLWPFIDYPMYSGARYKGDSIARLYLFGTLENSTEVAITPEDLGLGHWHFRKHFINGLARNNYEAVKIFVELYQNMQKRRLVSLRLEDHPLILLRDGVRSAPPQVVKNLRLESLEVEK